MKFLLVVLFVSAASSSIYQPTRLPAIPLVVRSPYLSTWVTAPAKTLYGAWPTFWNGHAIKAMAGMVRVDGTTYVFMGLPPGNSRFVVQEKLVYTATQSKFTMKAGPVELQVNFLSPVEPNDLKRMSIPASYIYTAARSTDGKQHDVQVYVDMTAEWASGRKKDLEVAYWRMEQFRGARHNITVQNVQLKVPKILVEEDDQAEWGKFKMFTKQELGSTSQSGEAEVLRRQFVSHGRLTNGEDKRFRKIDDKWPAVAFAKDLGKVSESLSRFNVFSIAHVRFPAIQVNLNYKNHLLNSLWTKYFDNDNEMAYFFDEDFSNALARANRFDVEIRQKAMAVGGQNYAAIVEAATRQAMGGIELVVGPHDKPWLMLKEISSNGNCHTVDVIYPHFPIQYFLNPNNLKLMLDPHFSEQEAGFYPHKYAMHDLGTNYPRCVGHPDGHDEPMAVEESANMIIMTAAYVQASGDSDYAKQHYKLLKQWAGFLVKNGLYPGDVLTTDDFLGHIKNATNLSLKAIVGLSAMAKLARAVNNSADSGYFDRIAKEYVGKWEQHAMAKSKTHTKLGYATADDSWSMLYNIYPDRLLKTNIIPDKIVKLMDAWYLKTKQKYGIALQKGHNERSKNWSKSDWELFQAAVSNNEVRNFIFDSLVKFLNKTDSRVPFGDWFDVESAKTIAFANRPVMGGVFAPLTMTKTSVVNL